MLYSGGAPHHGTNEYDFFDHCANRDLGLTRLLEGKLSSSSVARLGATVCEVNQSDSNHGRKTVACKGQRPPITCDFHSHGETAQETCKTLEITSGRVLSSYPHSQRGSVHCNGCEFHEDGRSWREFSSSLRPGSGGSHRKTSRQSPFSKFSKFVATIPKPIGTTFVQFLQRTPDGEVYSDLSCIAFRLAFTSFFTNVIATGLPIGKLTIAFVVA
jgi:hypothetical protein